jgi:two-component system, OmpR family, response regulator
MEIGDMQGRYVLVIDNDEGIREIAVTALEDAGIASVSVADAAAGLARCAESPPAAILLDPMEGPMSDAEFIRAYRQLPGPHGPVILFSARSDSEAHAAAIGANGVITKPFELEPFVEQVRRYMGER